MVTRNFPLPTCESCQESKNVGETRTHSPSNPHEGHREKVTLEHNVRRERYIVCTEISSTLGLLEAENVSSSHGETVAISLIVSRSTNLAQILSVIPNHGYDIAT